MFRIDPMQFSKTNTMLFQSGRWFIFLDRGNYTEEPETCTRLAHRCKKEDREKYMEPSEWKVHSCCLIIADNQICQDCAAPVPKVFQGFFNLTKWSFE